MDLRHKSSPLDVGYGGEVTSEQAVRYARVMGEGFISLAAPGRRNSWRELRLINSSGDADMIVDGLGGVLGRGLVRRNGTAELCCVPDGSGGWEWRIETGVVSPWMRGEVTPTWVGGTPSGVECVAYWYQGTGSVDSSCVACFCYIDGTDGDDVTGFTCNHPFDSATRGLGVDEACCGVVRVDGDITAAHQGLRMYEGAVASVPRGFRYSIAAGDCPALGLTGGKSFRISMGGIAPIHLGGGLGYPAYYWSPSLSNRNYSGFWLHGSAFHLARMLCYHTDSNGCVSPSGFDFPINPRQNSLTFDGAPVVAGFCADGVGYEEVAYSSDPLGVGYFTRESAASLTAVDGSGYQVRALGFCPRTCGPWYEFTPVMTASGGAPTVSSARGWFAGDRELGLVAVVIIIEVTDWNGATLTGLTIGAPVPDCEMEFVLDGYVKYGASVKVVKCVVDGAAGSVAGRMVGEVYGSPALTDGTSGRLAVSGWFPL